MALLIVKSDGSELTLEKWGERRTVVNVEVDASVAGATVCPWDDLVIKMIPNGYAFVEIGFKEFGERKHDARCKEGNQQDDSAGDGEPSGG